MIVKILKACSVPLEENSVRKNEKKHDLLGTEQRLVAFYYNKRRIVICLECLFL